MTTNPVNKFLDIVSSNRKGVARGLYSICSANPEVIEACFQQAKEDDSLILIESTSNQVDQYGGYTGMRPDDFVGLVQTIAARQSFPEEMILLGGDHLGPNRWRDLPAEKAMVQAAMLIEAYVKAGYQKIHLDTSMLCADDICDRSKSLGNELAAERTMKLCKVAEETWKKFISQEPGLIYIIGTEVPPPGGCKSKGDVIQLTKAEDAALTLGLVKKSFFSAGLADAWNRVVGLVVQPGVEFGDDHVTYYQREKAKVLSNKILEYENLVFEVHSTDYQTESGLKALVEDHFCILKVGPWLTFAFREALFALEAMESELFGKKNVELSRLTYTLDKAMLSFPDHWKDWYTGDENEKSFKRRYSFSDRARYYWHLPELEKAKSKLFNNLSDIKIPLTLLSQFMPAQFYLAEEKFNPDPKDLLYSHIRTVASKYARACGLSQYNPR